MKPYYADESVTLHHGDCLDVLRGLPDASVDDYLPLIVQRLSKPLQVGLGLDFDGGAA